MTELCKLLKKAYSSELALECSKETEDSVAAFEKKNNTKIPDDYRTLLIEYGALNFSEEPHMYSLEDLEWAYPSFIESYQEYLGEYKMPEELNPFPIGSFGDGSIAILDRDTGKVFMLIHDCYEDVPIEDVADSFTSLVHRQAQSVVNFFDSEC